MKASLQEIADWMSEHCSLWDHRGVLEDDGSPTSVYCCRVCGAAVIDRHRHADWHLTDKETK